MADEKNIRLSVSYDGSRYHGWQRQKNGMTIQEMVEEKIKTMLGVETRLTSSGRTDAGCPCPAPDLQFQDQHVYPTGFPSKGPQRTAA